MSTRRDRRVRCPRLHPGRCPAGRCELPTAVELFPSHTRATRANSFRSRNTPVGKTASFSHLSTTKAANSYYDVSARLRCVMMQGPCEPGCLQAWPTHGLHQVAHPPPRGCFSSGLAQGTQMSSFLWTELKIGTLSLTLSVLSPPSPAPTGRLVGSTSTVYPGPDRPPPRLPRVRPAPVGIAPWRITAVSSPGSPFLPWAPSGPLHVNPFESLHLASHLPRGGKPESLQKDPRGLPGPGHSRHRGP